MRWVATVAMALAAANGVAAAERTVCNTITYENGVLTQIGAVIEPRFERLLAETGPAVGPIKIEPGLDFRPAGNGKFELRLFTYWAGGEAQGKNWREPGGISYRQAGFAMQWPNFERYDGSRVTWLRTIIKSGDATSTSLWEFEGAEFTASSGQVVMLHENMRDDYPHGWPRRAVYRDEYEAWFKAMNSGGTLSVTFYAYPHEEPIATAEVRWPDPVEAQRRAVRDIRALRQAALDGKCDKGLRNTIP